jgi:hypothetical protein
MTDSPRMVPITGRGAQALVWLYWATMAILAVWDLNEVRAPGPTIASLALFALMCALATLDRGSPLRASVAWIVALGWPVITMAISWNLLSYGGYAQWYLGAATTCAFYLALRGRLGFAWLTFGLVSAVVMAWAISTGIGVPTALVLMGKQAPILLVGTLFSLGIDRSATTITRLMTVEAGRAATEAAALATAVERRRRLAELDALATPLLRRLVHETPLTPDDRLQFADAEATLRDTLRARTLSVDPLVDTVRQARRRGVDVVLLDDSDPEQLDAADLATTIETIESEVRAATEGRIVARLLPAGRDEIATILIETATESRRVSVTNSTGVIPPPVRGS